MQVEDDGNPPLPRTPHPFEAGRVPAGGQQHGGPAPVHELLGQLEEERRLPPVGRPLGAVGVRGTRVIPKENETTLLVIDPRRPSDKLDDYSHALIGMGVNSQGAGVASGSDRPQDNQRRLRTRNDDLLAFDRLAPGWCDRS
jgi:hypothetical protein